MSELERIQKEISAKFGIELFCYAENTRPVGKPICDKQFDDVTDDGEYTFFRFLYRNVGYIGVITGATEIHAKFAGLLPAYIERCAERETELSKTESLKRILLGESSMMAIYKYETKYSVRDVRCFTMVLRVPKLLKEAIAVLEQYGGNSLDTTVEMSEDTCAVVKFIETDGDEYHSTVDYAEFLAQSLKEELGLDIEIGVGPTVRELKDVASSYARAENTLRYADIFQMQGNVHSYREFILVKMMEDISDIKLAEYLAELTDESSREVFEDDEMLSTAEAFLQSSLNVSETARNLYMHRNTLLYRLDKIEKATGLNLRSFSDAVSFRVLTLLYQLLGR